MTVFHRRMKLHFGSSVVVGDTVYGSSSDAGPAFFMALDLSWPVGEAHDACKRVSPEPALRKTMP